MKNIKIYVAILVLSASTSVVAKDADFTLTEEEQSLLKELMINTKVNMVAESDLKDGATDYQSDGDPMTLEIVMLEKGKGVDHVSDDGEVIFMHEKTKEKAQESFFTKAFYVRTKKRFVEKKQSLK